MLTASLATIIIVIAMACIFLRYGRRTFALSILPLVTVPLFYSLAVFVTGYITADSFLIMRVVSATLLVAVVLAGILFGVCSLLFKGKKIKMSYLICCGGFTLVFALVLLFDAIAKLS